MILYLIAYHVKSTGWIKISEEDVTDLHYKYQAASAQAQQ
jgi:hypothetical protein